MALQRKSIKGSGTVKLNSSVSSQDGTTVTTTETYTGPYAALASMQAGAIANAKSTSLVPTEAGEGRLEISYEGSPSESSTDSNSVSIEVVWQELRKPIETHKMFRALAADRVAAVRKMAEDGLIGPSSGGAEQKLYEYLVRGVTEWVTGVPVVRRTTKKRTGSLKAGSAWHRGSPPVSIGGFQFMKTADERHKEKGSYTQIEEWTGAEDWDSQLYPR